MQSAFDGLYWPNVWYYNLVCKTGLQRELKYPCLYMYASCCEWVMKKLEFSPG